jgi:hypothetical protein
MGSNGTSTATVGHNGGPPIDAPARGRGRPSRYTPELADRICQRLAEAESLRSICRESWAPGLRTVLAWVSTKPEFRRQYDIARNFGREMVGEDVLAIADGVGTSLEAIKEARRQIDAKKWHLGRMAPKRRGPIAKLGISAPVRAGARHGVLGEGARTGGAVVSGTPHHEKAQRLQRPA